MTRSLPENGADATHEAPRVSWSKTYHAEIKAYGANAAVTLAQLRFETEHRSPILSHTELADIIGLSPRQIRTAIGVLLDAGAIAVTKPGAGKGDQRCRYRVLGTVTHKSGTVTHKSGDRDSQVKSTTYKSLKEEELTTPRGGDDRMDEMMPEEIAPIPGQLGLGIEDDRPTRTEVKRSASTAVFGFQDFWLRHRVGRREPAMRAWTQQIKLGVTAAELHEQLDLYLAARRWWHHEHPEHPVNPMHLSTFLNSKRHDYEKDLEPADQAVHIWGHLLRYDEGARHNATLAKVEAAAEFNAARRARREQEPTR